MTDSISLDTLRAALAQATALSDADREAVMAHVRREAILASARADLARAELSEGNYDPDLSLSDRRELDRLRALPATSPGADRLLAVVRPPATPMPALAILEQRPPVAGTLPFRLTDDQELIEAELWSRVDRSAGPGACWLWTGPTFPDGYGRLVVYLPDRPIPLQLRAHRVAWVASFGGIAPQWPFILHACDTPACCAPHHLWSGTAADNAADRDAKQRQARGERIGQRLTTAQVLEIRRLAGEGTSRRELAERFRVNRTTIGHVLRRRTWAWLPDPAGLEALAEREATATA